MSVNLLELLSNAVTPGLVKALAGHLGEPEAAVGDGLGSLLPALIGGLASKASTDGGAGKVFSMLTDPKVDTGLLGNLGSLLGGGQSSTITSVGTTLLAGLFGADKLGGLGSALGAISGLRPSSAGSLVALAVPMVFGFLKKLVAERGLNAAGTASLLLGQKNFLANKLEPSLTAALGLGSPTSLLAGLMPGVAAGGTAAASGLSRWLPWLIGLALAVGLLWALFGGTKAPPPVVAPPAATTPVPMLDLKSPAKIFFETGKADINADGQTLIKAVAALLAADAGKKVDLTGYTDKTGDAAANQALAKNRAMAVKAALEAQGVAPERIAGKPPVFVEVGAGGADANARRVEITAQ